MVIVILLVEKFLAFYGIRKFSTMYQFATGLVQRTHSLSHCFLRILFNSVLPSTARLSKVTLSFRLGDNNLYTFPILLMGATCTVHHILIDLSIQKIVDELWKL